MTDRETMWGPLAERYLQPRPRRMLALDGGGIRGMITLEMLLGLERQLRAATGQPDLRLGDWFDYVAGTSTGAIIAAALARGMEVKEILQFYEESGPVMFHRRFLLQQLWALYDAEPLKKKLQEVFGKDTDLRPHGLRCLLMVVTRNITTDSPWPISSNPLAKYNDPTRMDCNLRIPLWQLVRASTAAPVYFPREIIQWDPANPTRTFAYMDGGTTPYNNPAFLLYRMATERQYRLAWPRGEDKLLLVSMGTGGTAEIETKVVKDDPIAPANLVGLVKALMFSSQVDQDINCRTIGRCTHGAPIDNELGDLIPPEPLTTDLGRAFTYARYDVDLSAAGLARLGLGTIDPRAVQELDSVKAIDDLRRIGQAAARSISLAHLGSFAPGRS